MSSLIDFVQFHEVDLPARLRSGNARLAAHDVTEVGAIGFHQEGTDHSYTYAVSYTHLDVYKRQGR